MHWVELICLANSRKLRGRCVAGIASDTAKWIRPVSSAPKGELGTREYELDSGRAIRVLDVVRIPLAFAAPTPQQPENWRIGSETWEFVGRVQSRDAAQTLLTMATRGPMLLGGRADSVAAVLPQPRSLALVEPADVWWRLKSRFNQPHQARAIFSLQGQPYDLAVTDLTWERKIRALGLGDHEERTTNLAAGRSFLFTISLAEPFEGNSYKLVAAIIAF